MFTILPRDTPLVSVLMPAYNHERYLAAAIDSVLRQSFQDFEFIIINDGSTDGSERVILGYDDPRISYIAQENRDAYNALNRGLSLAVGKYVSILNSDDVYHPERLATLVAAAEQRQASFLFTRLRLIDENGTELADRSAPATSWYAGLLESYTRSGSLAETLGCGNVVVTTSNFFFTRELAAKIGMFRQFRYAHDYDFALRALFADPERVCFLAERPLLDYRIHPANTIAAALEATYRERFRILLDLLLSAEDDRRKELAAGYLETLYSEVLAAWADRGAVYASLSWKLTRPLRQLGNWLHND